MRDNMRFPEEQKRPQRTLDEVPLAELSDIELRSRM
jgi:hypothetical protein